MCERGTFVFNIESSNLGSIEVYRQIEIISYG